jgi:hypothetical protein
MSAVRLRQTGRLMRNYRHPHVADQAADSRHDVIAQAAYFLAQARGFEPGHELDEWLAAEKRASAPRERQWSPAVTISNDCIGACDRPQQCPRGEPAHKRRLPSLAQEPTPDVWAPQFPSCLS